MSDRRAVIPKAHEKAAKGARYSPAYRVGDVIHVSGQVGRDDDLRVIPDPAAQFRAAFENVLLVLTEAGAELSDVVDLMTFHTSFDDFDVFRQVKDEFFTTEPYPAWTAVGVTELAVPGLRTEIRCTAVVDT